MDAQNSQAIVKVGENTAIMPSIQAYAMTLEEAKETHSLVRSYCKGILREGPDYGEIPGTKRKTLKKSGAENLCVFLRLRAEFHPLTVIEDFDKSPAQFQYRYECRLHHIPTGNFVGSGIGSCNSMESKYRYRFAKRKCPVCESETILKSKWADKTPEKGWYCYEKIGGCKATFHIDNLEINDQKVGKVLNEDTADQANTMDKMAQKRSLVAATLIVTGLSGEFTQDMEEYKEKDSPKEKKAAEPEKKEKKKPAPKTNDFELSPLRVKFKGMLHKVSDFFPEKTDDPICVYVTGMLENPRVVEKYNKEQLTEATGRMEKWLEGSKNGNQSSEDVDEPDNVQAPYENGDAP